MRILAAGDIHGDISVAAKLAKKATENNVDLVVLAGDITHDDSLDNVLKPLSNTGKKILLISGNHESFATADFLAYINKASHLHGYSATYEDIGIFACGSANIGIHGITENDILETLRKGHEKISNLKKKIMVTHVHPAMTKMEKLSLFIPGSTGVLQAIKELKPKILICSHVHEAEGLEEQVHGTLVINVGAEGKILDL